MRPNLGASADASDAPSHTSMLITFPSYLDSRDSQFGVSEFPFVDWVPMAVNVLRLGQAMVKDPIPAAGPHERVLKVNTLLDQT